MCFPCHNTPESKEATFAVCVTFPLAAVVIVNIMALHGYFNHVIVGITNTTFYGVLSASLIFAPSNQVNPERRARDRAAYVAGSVILATIAGLASLAIPQILSMRAAIWLTLPLASHMLLGSSLVTLVATYQCCKEMC